MPRSCAAGAEDAHQAGPVRAGVTPVRVAEGPRRWGRAASTVGPRAPPGAEVAPPEKAASPHAITGPRGEVAACATREGGEPARQERARAARVGAARRGMLGLHPQPRLRRQRAAPRPPASPGCHATAGAAGARRCFPYNRQGRPGTGAAPTVARCWPPPPLVKVVAG